MNNEKGGRYKIIRTRDAVRSSGIDAPVGKVTRAARSYLSDKVAIDFSLPEKAKKLAIAFAEVGDTFRLSFLEKVDKEKEQPGFYEHYERILDAIKNNADLVGPELREAYLLRAAWLFKCMKNELSAAPMAYMVLRKCLRGSRYNADEFVEKAIAAKDNEALPKVCKEYLA